MSFNYSPFGIASSGFSASNALIRDSVFGSLNGQSLVVSAGGVFVNGVQLERHSLPAADRIEITALDKNGNKMESFEYPANGSLTLEITAGGIQSVKVTQGSVRIGKAQRIEKVETAAGSIIIDNCKSIEHATTMSGNVEVQCCDHLGSASSMSGSVRVAAGVGRVAYSHKKSKSADKRAASPPKTRDASPVRKPSTAPSHPAAVDTRFVPALGTTAEVFNATPGDRSCPYCKSLATCIVADDPTQVETAKELLRICGGCQKRYVVKRN